MWKVGALFGDEEHRAERAAGFRAWKLCALVPRRKQESSWKSCTHETSFQMLYVPDACLKRTSALMGRCEAHSNNSTLNFCRYIIKTTYLDSRAGRSI